MFKISQSKSIVSMSSFDILLKNIENLIQNSRPNEVEDRFYLLSYTDVKILKKVLEINSLFVKNGLKPSHSSHHVEIQVDCLKENKIGVVIKIANERIYLQE